MPLQIERATLQQRDLVRNLLNMYLHEMSQFEAVRVGEDGNMEYPPFSCYWVEPERHAFLFKVREQIAGFGLIRDIESYKGAQVHTVAEFFIMHSYRRLGIGEEIARIVFDRFPGKWQVAVQEENKAARSFWKTVVWRYTGGKMHEFRTTDWKGPVFEFSSPGAKPPTGE